MLVDYLKKLLKFLPIIGVVLFIYLIYDIGPNKILNAFSSISYYYFIFANIPLIPFLLLMSYKWQYISKKQKINLSFNYFVKLSLIHLFYIHVIPAGIGGYVRIFYLKKKTKATLEKCIVNMLLDSTTGSIIGFLIAVIGSFVIIDAFPGFFPVLLGFFIFNLTTFLILMKKSSGTKIFNFFIRPLIPKKYKEKLGKSFESFYIDLPRLRDTIIPFIMEIGIWICLGLEVYIISLAFSLNIPFHMFILIHTISVVIIFILPISIGGLGVREGAFVLMLNSLYGVEKEIALVISLSGYIVKMLAPTILGLILTIKDRKEI